MNLYSIALNQTNAVAEAQTIGPEKVDVNVPGAPMSLVFEMVVLDILKAMAHFCFARSDSFRPKTFARAFNLHFSGNGVERGIDYQFWTEGSKALESLVGGVTQFRETARRRPSK